MKRCREQLMESFERLFQREPQDNSSSPSTLGSHISNGSSLSFQRRETAPQSSSDRVILATSSKHTSTDCVSSTALMVYRGIGAGIAWTIGVDLYALVGASELAWREHLATQTQPTTKAREFTKLLVKSCGRNVLLFGGFLTVFGGLTCSMEMVRGRHDIVNPFIGGFASGLVIMPREMYKTPKLLVGGAALCGAAAMALYQFVPASSQGIGAEEDYDGEWNARGERRAARETVALVLE